MITASLARSAFSSVTRKIAPTSPDAAPATSERMASTSKPTNRALRSVVNSGNRLCGFYQEHHRGVASAKSVLEVSAPVAKASAGVLVSDLRGPESPGYAPRRAPFARRLCRSTCRRRVHRKRWALWKAVSDVVCSAMAASAAQKSAAPRSELSHVRFVRVPSLYYTGSILPAVCGRYVLGSRRTAA